MTATNKAKNVAENAKGKLKQAHGKAVGDPALEAEGKGVQAKSDLKQAGEKAKDAVVDATDTKTVRKAPRAKVDVKKAEVKTVSPKKEAVKADVKKAAKKVKAAAKH